MRQTTKAYAGHAINTKPERLTNADMAHVIDCATCGRRFEAKHKRKYCHPECRDSVVSRRKTGKNRKQWLDEAHRRNTYTCKHCNKPYLRKRRVGDEGKTCCSRECGVAYQVKQRQLKRIPKYCKVWFPHCNICGHVFVSRRSKSHICSYECRNEYIKKKAEEGYQSKVINCKECGVSFETQYGCKRTVFCSQFCCKKNTKRIAKAKRRAVEKGIEAEAVDPIAVFERDGWKCQICRKPTPRNRRGTNHGNAPELDHRMPISVGGEHTYANTQCACRQCNQGKGNASEVGQYPLFKCA